MKKIIVYGTIVIITFLLFQSCKKDSSEPGAVELKTALLIGTWNIESAKVDDVDRTDFFAGLKLTFSNTSLIVTDPGNTWSANSTWKFVDEAATIVELSDGMILKVVGLSSDQLSISFTSDHGISADRIVNKSYEGETKLVNNCDDANQLNCSSNAHQLNRRTDFEIVK